MILSKSNAHLILELASCFVILDIWFRTFFLLRGLRLIPLNGIGSQKYETSPSFELE